MDEKLAPAEDEAAPPEPKALTSIISDAVYEAETGADNEAAAELAELETKLTALREEGLRVMNTGGPEAPAKMQQLRLEMLEVAEAREQKQAALGPQQSAVGVAAEAKVFADTDSETEAEAKPEVGADAMVPDPEASAKQMLFEKPPVRDVESILMERATAKLAELQMKAAEQAANTRYGGEVDNQ